METKKGQANFGTIISGIMLIFVLMILLFSLVFTGNRLSDTLDTRSGTQTVNNETVYFDGNATPNGLVAIQHGNFLDVQCTMFSVTNETAGEFVINSANYTASTDGCKLSRIDATSGYLNGTNWNISYTYTYLSDGDVIGVINTTNVEASNTTDYFSLILVMIIITFILGLFFVAVGRMGGLMGGQGGV